MRTMKDNMNTYCNGAGSCVDMPGCSQNAIGSKILLCGLSVQLVYLAYQHGDLYLSTS